MSTNKLIENVSDESDISSIKQPLDTYAARKKFHQLFNFYIAGLFFVVLVVLLYSMALLSQQYKFSKTLLSDHFTPLKVHLLQQTYLINSNKLINEVLQSTSVNETFSYQEELSLQSKKLSLLQSEYKPRYQEWFLNNNNATKLIVNIKDNYSRHELLRDNSLLQIDTLLDAIAIELDKKQLSSKHNKLLLKANKQLTDIAILLKNLTLETKLEEFKLLRRQIEKIFEDDYAKQLANLQNDLQGVADIVRDLIRFEDLILKQDLLVKWASQLGSVVAYKQALITQQQQLETMLNDLVEDNSAITNLEENTLAVSAKRNGFLQSIKDMGSELPRGNFTVFALGLWVIAGLLWLFRRRIKIASEVNRVSISQAIHEEKQGTANKFEQRHNEVLLSEESAQLIRELQQINESTYSKKDHLTLTELTKAQEEKLTDFAQQQEKLALELESVEAVTSEKFEAKLLLEHQRCNNVYLGAIKQLVLLGHSSASSTINSNNTNRKYSEGNYLYHSYLQGRDLLRQLRQAKNYRYLLTSNAVLTLSDVNIASQIQAILLNLRHTLFLCNNKVSVNIDKKVLTGVNLDAELFSELLRIFIRILLADKTGTEVVLTLQLIDKNKGQQKVCFVAKMQSSEKQLKLPVSLKILNGDNEAESELGEYFKILLRYQHGEDLHAKLTEQGVQLSFTMPLAVNNYQASHKDEQYESLLLLPSHIPEIDKTCESLTAKYLAIPIEVLIAVNNPEKHQRLQQLLQAMGLQTMFVTCKSMLDSHWKSGRFFVLITEFEYQPFISFIVEQGDSQFDKSALTKGVFSLKNSACILEKPAEYSHWIAAELNTECDCDELIKVMQPWTKKQLSKAIVTETMVDSQFESTTLESNLPNKVLSKTTSAVKIDAFNFERYIKNQGSAELAIFMLEEYTTENTAWLVQLSLAFSKCDVQKAETAIQSLIINSKILAADELLDKCQQGLKYITSVGLHHSNKVQNKLLNDIKKSVNNVNQHADAVV